MFGLDRFSLSEDLITILFSFSLESLVTSCNPTEILVILSIFRNWKSEWREMFLFHQTVENPIEYVSQTGKQTLSPEIKTQERRKKAEKQGIKSKMGDKVLRFTQKQREINR
jgi:hypothetical protein